MFKNRPKRGVNPNKNVLSRRRSGARRCYRKYSPTPEKSPYGRREGGETRSLPARSSLETVPLPSLPLSLLLCSHLEAHRSAIRSPIPSNSAPLPKQPLAFAGTLVCLMMPSVHCNRCLMRGERKAASAVRCVPVRTERLVSRSRTWFPVLAEFRPPSSVLHLSFIVCACVWWLVSIDQLNDSMSPSPSWFWRRFSPV